MRIEFVNMECRIKSFSIFLQANNKRRNPDENEKASLVSGPSEAFISCVDVYDYIVTSTVCLPAE